MKKIHVNVTVSDWIAAALCPQHLTALQHGFIELADIGKIVCDDCERKGN